MDGFITDYDLALRNGCLMAHPGKPILNCYPHIVGKIDGSWKLKFQPRNRNLIMSRIRMLHSCISLSQFCTRLQLVLEEWFQAGEAKFCLFFEARYGPDSECGGLWFCFASGVVYFGPNNNMIERHFMVLKGQPKHGTPPVICWTVGMDQFVNQELPKLVHHDLVHNCGVGTGRMLSRLGFLPLDTPTLALVALMSEKDVFVVIPNDEFYVNRPQSLNWEHSPRRREIYQSSVTGSHVPLVGFPNRGWTSPLDNSSAGDEYCHVFRVSRTLHADLYWRVSICHGFFCECIKFTTTGVCPAVVFLLDLFKELDPPLAERYQAIHTSTAGSM
jgi:hypothetical protein